MNYKDSGVDLEAGRSFVETLKHKAPSIGVLVVCLRFLVVTRNLF